MSRVSAAVMRAVRIAQFGGPEVLKLETNVPVPEPNNNQVRVKVHSAGVNPVDTYIRSGTYAVKPALPYTPGFDVGGVVDEVGSDVTSFKKGDRVFTMETVSGGYAEYTVADPSRMGRLHDNLTLEQGGAVGIAYVTAIRAMDRGHPQKGQKLLVHGASGAVGLACVQIGRAKGMTVIGTAGTQEGLDLVKNEGAHHVFNHRESGYTDKIMEACGGEGPDVIMEMLANVNLEKDMQMAAVGGYIVLVGSRGTIEITPRFCMGKQLTITGLTYFKTKEDERQGVLQQIEEGMKAGWLRPFVGHKYSLDQASQAHEDIINSKGALGKMILTL